MNDIRKPAVSNIFYPGDKANLKRVINTYLSNVPADILGFFKKQNVDNLFSIVVPHAGYVYSGQAAAYGYSLLRQKHIDTVILIGPSHYNDFDGFAVSKYSAFETPFGDVKVNADFNSKLVDSGSGLFKYLDTAHIREHSLEVQLPFLQTVIGNEFDIVPVLMGWQTEKNVSQGAEVLSGLLKDTDKNYLLLISSDLSHYHDDTTSRRLDAEFIEYLLKMDFEALLKALDEQKVEACGGGPVAVMMETAKKLSHPNVKNLIYTNSGEASGDFSRVVGYLSAVVW